MLKARYDRLIFTVSIFFAFFAGSYTISSFYAVLLGKPTIQSVGIFDWVGDVYQAILVGEIGFLLVLLALALFFLSKFVFVPFFILRWLARWVGEGE